MTQPKVTRKVYSAEELHRLRSSQSQPKLREAIEEHDAEDAEIVKEHVLRGSKSFTARSFRSRDTSDHLHVPSNHARDESSSAAAPDVSRSLALLHPHCMHDQILGEIPPNSQLLRRPPYKFHRSPTPSLKKQAAEAIVKAHGSPTHVRVTARGRIVPSEQSPLCHPRYGYSAIKTNGGLIKFAPNHRPGQPQQWTQTSQATKNGSVVQDMHGNLCQIVNGIVMPLDEADGAIHLHMPAPNLTYTQSSVAGASTHPSFRANTNHELLTSLTNLSLDAEPSVEIQITALELEYKKLQKELLDLNRTDAMHGSSLGSHAKAALVTRRRELVINSDKLRKAIKELSKRPPPNAPTSPRAMSKRHSSPYNADPGQLQGQPISSMAASRAPGMHGQVFSGESQFGEHYPIQPMLPAEELYPNYSLTMPSQNALMTLPLFDGSVATTYAAQQQGQAFGPSIERMAEGRTSMGEKASRNNGSQSSVSNHGNLQPHSSAVASGAVEMKPTANIKSALNPMSPVYKPALGPNNVSVGSDTTNTQQGPQKPKLLSASQQMQPQSHVTKSLNATDDTVSPSKTAEHVQSSSISSFETADFFPRDTRAYSIRPYAYPYYVRPSEDKENADPERSSTHFRCSPLTPGANTQQVEHHSNVSIPYTGGFSAPAPSPGTPVHYETGAQGKPIVASGSDVPNRNTNNVSPKNKREWLFIREQPDRLSLQDESSPEKTSICREARATTESSGMLDITQKPREWIEGYQAGLHRRIISNDRIGPWLEGYCAGLLKSQPKDAPAASAGPSTSSPLRPTSRRPSPALTSRTSSRMQLVEKALGATRPPLESSKQSMDTLKQAVFAPQNKNAVLTPTVDGPHISEAPLNLGSWAKSQYASGPPGNRMPVRIESFHLPMRTTSAFTRPDFMSETDIPSKQPPGTYLQPGTRVRSSDNWTPQPSSPLLSIKSLASNSIISQSAPTSTSQIGRMASIDASIYRPGPRVMTPTEWKAGSSVAHAAGLATGYFANAQFDGAIQQRRTDVAPDHRHALQQSRFKERSLDGLSDPTMSPMPMSPTPSAIDTPRRQTSGRKTPSPAKAKFEHIAGKVGIKVSSACRGHEYQATDAPATGSLEPSSPPDKRRWRDIWRKTTRDGQE